MRDSSVVAAGVGAGCLWLILGTVITVATVGLCVWAAVFVLQAMNVL